MAGNFHAWWHNQELRRWQVCRILHFVLADVNDPSTQALLSKVPLTTASEFDAAVANAHAAFPAWRETSLLTRQQVMFKLQALIRDHMDDIANAIVLEQGKTFVDAKGDVLRGLQVVEVACGITSTLMEERIEVSKGYGHVRSSRTSRCDRCYCSFQLPRHDPSGPSLWPL